jgi:tetratricopeptide (TPR) repeat protein
MNVGTDYSTVAQMLTAGLGLEAGYTAATGSQSTASSFGPATLLSLGSTGVQQSQWGYTNLGTTFQFDLNAVYQARIAATVPQVSPAVAQREDSMLAQVESFLEAGALDEARGLLESFLKDSPNSGRSVHALGVVELEERNYAQSEKLFRRAAYLAPDNGFDEDAEVARYLQQDDESVFAAARRLVSNSDTLQTGTQLLVALTHRNPLHTEGRMLLGNVLLHEGDAVNGLSQYRLAIATADDEQLQRIEARFEKLVEVAPRAPYVHRLLGETQLRLGKNDEAARTLARATELADGDATYRAAEAPAHVAIGQALLADNRITAAMAAFEHAATLQFANHDARLGLAEAYVARGEQRARLGLFADAISDFSTAKARLRNDGSAELRKRLAAAAFSAGAVLDGRHRRAGEKIGDEAVALQIAYDLDPDNATYRISLADLRNRSGDEFMADEDYRNAAHAYKRAYDLFKNDETYRDNTASAFVLYGNDLMRQHRFDDAVEAYRTSYEITRSDTARLKLAEAYNARGQEYLSDTKYRQAREYFRKALYYDPGNPLYQENYGATL